jgi:hypothetical protein
MTYKGYTIATGGLPHNLTAYVYDRQDWREGKPHVYKTTSLDLARKWIEAYRKGEQWAVEAHAH